MDDEGIVLSGGIFVNEYQHEGALGSLLMERPTTSLAVLRAGTSTKLINDQT